jgi:penicillin-binding protein 1C
MGEGSAIILMKKRARIWKFVLIALLLSTAVIYWFPGPALLFDDPSGTVLLDQHGELLGARIADDGQWRFPPSEQVPEKFHKAILLFEDRYFHYHPGVNPFSLVRATWQNIKSRSIVSGGSTLTMQVIRLSRKGKPRTITEKMLEMVLALKLEMRHSKQEILAMYAGHAPFGGNVVGLDAAAWRYFGLPAGSLSWAETAALAVLPNAPALIHPGRNRGLLLQKRDRLLLKLLNEDIIDSLTYRLSLQEPLPGAPVPLPRAAPHLLDRLSLDGPGKSILTSVDARLQEKVSEVVDRYSSSFSLNGVHNAAALVLRVGTGEALAYVGNVAGEGHANDVDIIHALRSPGSLLKPLLFAAMLEESSLLPNTLLPDIPTIISGYSPKNFDRKYEGAVPAKRALEKSLNVPAVKMLQEYTYERFYHLLEKMGITTLANPPDYYGLSLILGGAEMSLWEMCGMYASMSRILGHYYPHDGKYDKNDIHPPVCLKDPLGPEPVFLPQKPLSAASIYLTFEALLEVNRPEQEAGWEYFSSTRRIAWKTGTSFGFRDGWAIGTTPDYVVGVWVGNADGEGRPGLTGVTTAAPVMFEIFDALPSTGWYDKPYDELERAAVCRKSGHLKSEWCTEWDSLWICRQGLSTGPCPYHHLLHTDPLGKYRLNYDCARPGEMTARSWFVLPPVMEWYYKMTDPSYKELPPFKEGCQPDQDIPMMEFIYPENSSRIYIPVELDGTPGDAIFELAHRKHMKKVFWHLDEDYFATTLHSHQVAVRPGKGNHLLKVVDEDGYQAEVFFTVESDKR